jgi:geranylgeranyl diphosphate synthase type 3
MSTQILQAFNYAADVWNSKPQPADGVPVYELLYSWFPISNENREKFESIFLRSLHFGSLLDNIQDSTPARNGKPTAHMVYGVPLTLNSGVIGLADILMDIASFNNQRLTQVFLEEFKDIYVGQGLQLQWNCDKKCPKMEEVIDVCSKKGACISLGGRILAALSGVQDDSKFFPILKKLNTVMQVCNDIDGCVDLRDIKEGQYNFVTVYTIQQEKLANGISRLEEIMFTPEKDDKMLNEARDIMTQYGAFEFSNKFVDQLTLDIIQSIREVGGNVKAEEVLSIKGIRKVVSFW